MDLNKKKNVLYYTIGDYMEITNKDIEFKMLKNTMFFL